MNRALLVLMILMLGRTVKAQEPAAADSSTATAPRPALPSGPLLQAAPAFSRWEINFTYPEEPGKKEKSPANPETLPRQIITTKTDKIIHEVTTYLSGKQTDKWYSDKLQYEKATGTNSWRVKTGSITNKSYDDGTYVPYPATGFRDLDWIGPGAYIGTIPAGNRSCLVFSKFDASKISLSDPNTQKKVLETQQTIAFIDAETRFPITMREGKVVRVYHFTEPPAGMQAFPVDLAGEIKKGQDAQTRLMQLPPRPY